MPPSVIREILAIIFSKKNATLPNIRLDLSVKSDSFELIHLILGLLSYQNGRKNYE